ncbi:hypothetical protein OA845_03085, partial [Candidatus Pelagibacter sp.]|nr:hypothetical protein [Candidatus Pelagibacter sp.]
FSYLENINLTKRQYSHSKFRNKLKSFSFVLRGIVGQKNDIVVDDVMKPKKIFGICDGSGGFIVHNFNEKKNILNKIKKKITNINPSYD